MGPICGASTAGFVVAPHLHTLQVAQILGAHWWCAVAVSDVDIVIIVVAICDVGVDVIGVVVVVAIGVVDDVAIGLILNVTIGGVIGICDDLFWKVVYGLSGQYLLLLLLQGLGKVNIMYSAKCKAY